MIISLIGYMGCGKSTVAKKLSGKLQIPVVDLDKEIEKREGMVIPEIFKTKGEIYFRKTEHQILESLLFNTESCILSTGGGTPVFYNNMDVLNRKSITFYLQATPVELTQRLEPEKEKRPLIAHLDNDNLTEFIAKHLFERSPFYQKAEHTISVGGKSVEKIADNIICLLPNRPRQT